MKFRSLVACTLVIGASLLGAVAVAPSAGAAEPTSGYIVTLRPDVDPAQAARRQDNRSDVAVEHVFTRAVRGYSAVMTATEAARLRREPGVRAVEPDGVATVVTTQSGPTWGLDRIDQRSRTLSKTFSYTRTGTGVTAYVVDTGIAPHADLGARVTSLVDTVDGDLDATDCNGHGTHVAGTIGGTTYGVAKGVSLVAVRVLNCEGSGTYSGIIAGLDRVIAHHEAGKPAVVNMSLGGGASTALDTAVRNTIADGITVVVAAGNSGANASYYSPARVKEAVTVGATDTSDTRARFSNYGSVLDLFAPGVGIRSTWLGGTSASSSGTSMATPHVAGVAALYLQGSPTASPSGVAYALVTASTKNVVYSSAGSPNRLLFTSW